MRINIDIDWIVRKAQDDYFTDNETDLADAPMTDIADYSLAATSEYLDNLMAELLDEIGEIVERDVQQ